MTSKTVELIQNSYRNSANYKIVEYQNASNICFVFCSSNGIYSGKSDDQIRDFVNNNRFEWENISSAKTITSFAKKIIYIKDPFQHSYVDGINSEINSISKILVFLEKETKGMSVYAIGNSGGGYLALIIGSRLKNVERVYSFGGIFSLYDWTGADNNFKYDDCKFLTSQQDEEKIRFYNIVPELLKSETESIKLHFYSFNNVPDYNQITLVKNIVINNLFIFGFNSKKHGVTVNSFDYFKLFTMNQNKLNKIIKTFSNKQNSIKKNRFSICLNGLVNYVFYQLKRLIRKICKFFRKK